MRTFLLPILPYSLCVLLGPPLFLEQNQDRAGPAVERPAALEAKSDTDRLTSKQITEQGDAAEKSTESPSHRGNSAADLARLERAVNQADRPTLQRLAEQLTKRYAADFAVLARVHLQLAEGWGRLDDLPRRQTALEQAGTALDEIRAKHVLIELRCLTFRAIAEGNMHGWSDRDKTLTRIGKFPFMRSPFYESRHHHEIGQYCKRAVLKLLGPDNYHKFHDEDEKIFLQKFFNTLEMIRDELTHPEGEPHKHVEAILEYMKSGA